MLGKFNEQSQKIIVEAERISYSLGHKDVGSEHLLVSLLKNDTKLKEIVRIDAKIIEEDIKQMFGKNEENLFYVDYSYAMKSIMNKCVESTQEEITPTLLSIYMIEEKSVAYELLKKYRVDTNQLLNQLKNEIVSYAPLDHISTLTNINKRVQNKNHKVIGRDDIVYKVCTIISKKEKSNVLLIGKAGVGKSAIVEKMADMMNNNELPIQKYIYELSLASLVAGTKYRGEFEEKLKKIIDQVKDKKDVVLFIDEIHNLIGAGGAEGAIDGANILKPYLARNDLTVIGATTIDEYYKHFEHDRAMNRRFTILTVEENTKEETQTILKEIKHYYENYHNVLLHDECLNYIIDMCEKYFKEKTYPDKAIDLLDLSCVHTKLSHEKIVLQNHINQTIENMMNMHMYHRIDKQAIIACLEKYMEEKQASDIAKIIHRKSNTSMLLKGYVDDRMIQELAKSMQCRYVCIDLLKYQTSDSLNYLLGHSMSHRPGKFLMLSQNNEHIVFHIKHMNEGHDELILCMSQLLEKRMIEDRNHHQLSFHQAMIIVCDKNEETIGFVKRKQHKNKIYDYIGIMSTVSMKN